jgi:hypothetical protein
VWLKNKYDKVVLSFSHVVEDSIQAIVLMKRFLFVLYKTKRNLVGSIKISFNLLNMEVDMPPLRLA